jgi:hypothetical protein
MANGSTPPRQAPNPGLPDFAFDSISPEYDRDPDPLLASMETECTAPAIPGPDRFDITQTPVDLSSL